VSAAALLALAAGVAAVLGAWEALVAVEGARLPARLARAAAPLARAGREGHAPTAAERRRLALLAAATLLAGGWLLAGLPAGLLAALTGPAVVLGLVRARRRHYAEEVGRGAPACARALADALAAGHSVPGAIAQAAPALPGPAGHELRDAAAAFALGEPLDAVLERLRCRAHHPGWDAIVAAILLQRDAGGDLAGLLRELAGALEAAERSLRDARAVTAQARFTAWLVAGLPLGTALLAETASPGFIAGLVNRPLSAYCVGLAAMLQIVALVCIRRISRPQVWR
jgi:tight adherence protein B